MKELKPHQYLSKNEVQALSQTVQEKAAFDREKGRKVWPRIEMMINVALGTGLRVAELAELKVKHLKLKSEPSVHVANGKGGRSRDVLISDTLKRSLKKYIQANRLKDEDYLLNVNGKPYTTMGLQQQFKKAAKAAGLSETYSIHCLRHTYGTYLYEKERDLRMVQNQLGHSSVNTTAIYAGVAKERTFDAVNGLYS